MNLREKTSLIVVILLIAILTIISIFVSFVSMTSYSTLERQYVLQDVDQAVNRLSDEYTSLSSIVADWGPWDDTYDFVNGDKPGYVAANLVPEAYSNLRVNIIIITNASGGIAYAGAYDLVNHTMVAVPESLTSQLNLSNPLLTTTDPKKTTTGILMVKEQPLIVASRPIVRSNFSGTPRGVVIMGRYLDAGEISYLAELTVPDLNFVPVDDPSLPPSLLSSISSGQDRSTELTIPLDSRQVVGYALIKDVYGKGALVLEIIEPRDIYGTGRTTTLQYVFIVLGAGLLFGIVILLILDRLVLSRVNELSRQVNALDRQTVPGGQIHIGGNDEFSGLAVEINHLLATIERSRDGLIQSEARFRDLAELLPQTIFEMDLQGGLTFINRTGSEIFGLGDEKIRNGANVRDYLIAEDFERMNRGLAQVKSGAKSHGEVYHIKRHDGALMSAIVYTGPVYRDGRVAGFRGIVIDITERVDLENALKDSEEKYRALTENTPDILFSTDMNGIITYASPQVNKYGFLVDEVIGKSLRVFIHPADIDRVKDNLARELKENAQFISRFRVLDKWGATFWFEEKSTLRLDLSGKPMGMYGILRDVTERKRVEYAIEIANRKLNLMNQITRHDILNNITGLLGCVDMSKATDSLEERDLLLDEIRDLTRVIQRHILFTKEYQEVGVHLPQWQNVSHLISKTVQNFSKSGITFKSEFEKMEIYADPLLEKVFYNLIDNATRYGTTLTTISIYSGISDKGFSLVFEDDGIGVEESQKREIFKRGVGKNTGMGLFLSAEILAITGITIEENGVFGRGARFELRVPNGLWRLPKN